MDEWRQISTYMVLYINMCMRKSREIHVMYTHVCVGADPPSGGGAPHSGREHRGTHACAARQEKGASGECVCAQVARETKGNEGGGCEAANEDLRK